MSVVEIAMGVERHCAAGATSAPAVGALKAKPATPQEASTTSSSTSPSAPPPTVAAHVAGLVPARVLQAQPSDEGVADAAETIAAQCKSAFEQGLWTSADPLNASTVSFWLTRYKEHVLGELERFPGSADKFLE